jgi:uncharacterized protein YcbK (DUF882 family)
MGDLSEHFNRSEFECPCCGKFIENGKLLSLLEELRGVVGVPVVVLSGTRCEKHNERVGGSRYSYHLKGMAADVVCDRSRMAIMVLYLLGVMVDRGLGVGLILPSGSVHVDVRGNRASWSRDRVGGYERLEWGIVRCVKEGVWA